LYIILSIVRKGNKMKNEDKIRWYQPVTKKHFNKKRCETKTLRCRFFHPIDDKEIVGLCSSEFEYACGCCREMKKLLK